MSGIGLTCVIGNNCEVQEQGRTHPVINAYLCLSLFFCLTLTHIDPRAKPFPKPMFFIQSSLHLALLLLVLAREIWMPPPPTPRVMYYLHSCLTAELLSRDCSFICCTSAPTYSGLSSFQHRRAAEKHRARCSTLLRDRKGGTLWKLWILKRERRRL